MAIDKPVEQARALADHVQMPVGERVEGAGVDGGARRGVGHGRGIGDFAIGRNALILAL